MPPLESGGRERSRINPLIGGLEHQIQDRIDTWWMSFISVDLQFPPSEHPDAG